MTHTRTFAYPRTFTGYRLNPPDEYTEKGITNGHPEYGTRIEFHNE